MVLRKSRWAGWVLSFLTAATVGARAQDSFAADYTKHVYEIPMRDGVTLYTQVHRPKDTSKKYPFLLLRTPYGLKPYTIDSVRKPGGFPESFVKEKFIFVRQDVRGRFGSGGTFVHVRPHNPAKSAPADIDESTDTYDTIDWLLKNVSGNNGSAGMTGISYPGFFAAAGMIDSHPALKAVSPQAPVATIFDGDDILHGGCFWLCHNWGFMDWFEQVLDDPTRQDPRPFDYGTTDGYRFFLEGGSLAELGAKHFKGRIRFWNDLMENLGDARWREARHITHHLKQVRSAVMTVGGLFDAEDLHGALATYRATERNNPGIENTLVLGPWSHGQWHGGDGDKLGPIEFHSKTAEYFRNEIELPFLRRYLKGMTNETVLPEALVFNTGVNEWRREAAWPPAEAPVRSLYLRAGGRLSFEAPVAGENPFDDYVSDPARPVPFTQEITTGMSGDYMVEDQRFATRRPDVLVFETEPLKEDVTLAGPITASLMVSTTGTDSDWVVKLIDVYTDKAPNPSGASPGLVMGNYHQLIRGEPFRGKYREGMDQPKPFEPGVRTRVEWVMPDVCHTFRVGHRIQVQVQSSWFPLADRNPQVFCDIYKARSADFRKATQRVYHVPEAASALRVAVLPPR